MQANKELKDWSQQIRDLSTSLNNFGSLKKPQGGGALKRPARLCVFLGSQNSSNCCLSLVFVGFNLLILCWLAGANDEVHSFKFNPYFLTFETLGIFNYLLNDLFIHIIIFHVFFTKRNLTQYLHRSALQAPYFACAEISWIAMFLAYQRASRPYKRLIFDEFIFFIFYMFCQFIFWGVGGMRL